MYKPSELREFLSSLGIQPKRSLSQNFLIDGNILRKIVATAEVKPDDVVLEIGPGPGSLTQVLVEAKSKIIAVEKDNTLATALKRFPVEVYNEDIMTFPVEETLSQHLPKGKKAKVIANLPYHITTPILIKLATMNQSISKIVVMVQDEVAKRIAAKPHTPEYGSLTLYLNFFSTPSYAFKVSKNCFYPVPKVDSAIVVLDLKTPPKVADQDRFFKMTRTSFQHRRKMLRSSLNEIYSPEEVTTALEATGLNPLARPEELSLEEFLKLFKRLDK